MVEKIKPLGRSVLIEQKLIKKTSSILTPGEPRIEDFEVSANIISIGTTVPNSDYGFNIGDEPILNKHSTPLNEAMISEEFDINKNRKSAILHLIVDYEDIVGIKVKTQNSIE